MKEGSAIIPNSTHRKAAGGMPALRDYGLAQQIFELNFRAGLGVEISCDDREFAR